MAERCGHICTDGNPCRRQYGHGHAAHRSAEQSAKYRANNLEKAREKEREASAKYYAAHREQRLEHQAKYYAAHREQRLEYQAKYRDTPSGRGAAMRAQANRALRSIDERIAAL